MPAVSEGRPRMPAVVTEERPSTSSVTVQPGLSAEDVSGPSSATNAELSADEDPRVETS